MGKTVQTIGKVAGAVGKIPGVSSVIGMLPGGGIINQGINAISNLSGGTKAALGAGAGLLGMGLAGGFKPQTGTIGGGAAGGVADAFSNYQGQFLNQNQGQMNQALTSMLNGRIGDPTSLQQYFGAGMGGNGMADIGQSNQQFNPNQINVGFTPEKFQATQLQQAQVGNPTQQIAGQGVNTQFDFGGIGVNYNPERMQSNFNAPAWMQAQLGGVQMATPDMLQDLTQGVGQRAQLDTIVNPAANAAAVSQLMDRQRNLDVANMRSRFGNQALGTGAQFAESQYLAEAMPRAALAIDDIVRQNQAQQLTQRAQDLQNQQGGRGMDIQQLMASSDQTLNALGQNNQAVLGLNAQNLQQSLAQNQFNQGNSQFGANLDFQAQQGNAQNAQFGANLGMQAGQANLNALIQAAQMGQQGEQFNASQDMQAQMANATNALQSMGYSNEAIQSMNAQELQQILAMNGFNQNNSQFGASFGQQGQNMNNQWGYNAAQMGQNNQQFNINAALQNQGMGNQWNMGLQNVGAQRQGQQLSAQQQAMNQILGMMGGTQQLGTAQRENTVAPSWGSQLINGMGAAGQLWQGYNQAQNLGQQFNPQASQGNPLAGVNLSALKNGAGSLLSGIGNFAGGLFGKPSTPAFNPNSLAPNPAFNSLFQPNINIAPAGFNSLFGQQPVLRMSP